MTLNEKTEKSVPTENLIPKRVLLKNVAYEKLLDLIISGVFPPGSFLAERKLAEILNMSKTPVKSSLERLEYEGFIKVSPQQGIVVCSPSLTDIQDLFDLRLALETFIVKKLAQRTLSTPQKKRIESNLSRQEQAARDKDMITLAKLDADFHLLLCETSENKQILQVMTLVKAKLQQMSFFVSGTREGRANVSVAEHRKIYEAIRSGQAEQAPLCMEQHLEYGKRVVWR